MKRKLCLMLALSLLLSLFVGCGTEKESSGKPGTKKVYITEKILTTESDGFMELTEYTFSEDGKAASKLVSYPGSEGTALEPERFIYAEHNLFQQFSSAMTSSEKITPDVLDYYLEMLQPIRKESGISDQEFAKVIALDPEGYPVGTIDSYPVGSGDGYSWYSMNWSAVTHDKAENNYIEHFSFIVVDSTDNQLYNCADNQTLKQFDGQNRLVSEIAQSADGEEIISYCYLYSKDENTIRVCYDNKEETLEAEYDRNGLPVKWKYASGFEEQWNEEYEVYEYKIKYIETSFAYQFRTVEIPEEAFEGTCRLYDYLGIHYVVDKKGVTVENTYSPDNKAVDNPIDEKKTTTIESSIGEYTLAEVSERFGFYIAYEDGSFDSYKAGGMSFYNAETATHISGLFLENDIVKSLPELTSDTNLVVVADSISSIILRPVNYEVGAIDVEPIAGKKGYAYIDSIYDEGISILVTYNDRTWEHLNPIYINSKKAEKYDAIYDSKIIKPYSGMPNKEYIVEYFGFQPNTTVTMGFANGSTLKELTFEANTTYFDCQSDRNDYHIEDIYYLDYLPTVDGYALIDMSEIPNGKYIIYLDMGKKYTATIINWNAP